MGISLGLTVMLSAFLFGAVEAWSMAIIGLLTASLFVFFVLKTGPSGVEAGAWKGILLSLAAILAYAVFQLFPLPSSFLSVLHPGTREILAAPPGETSPCHSISIYPYATEMELAGLAVTIMAFLLALFSLREKRDFEKAILVLAVLGFVLAVFGIIQKGTWNGKLYWVRELTQGGLPFGPYVNRNHFAGFMNMIIFLCLGSAFTAGWIEKKAALAFLSVVMATALFFSLSRAGIISFFAGVATFSFVVFAKSVSRRRLIPVMLFVLAVTVYLLSLGVTPVLERFAQREVSQEDRLVVWQGTLAAFRDFPVFGSGLGTFKHVFRIYQPDGLRAYFDHAHNDYLEYLLEGGIAGVFVGAFFLFFTLKAILEKRWRQRDIYMQAGFLSSLATITVHSLFDFNLHIPSNALLFSLVLGMAASFQKAKDS